MGSRAEALNRTGQITDISLEQATYAQKPVIRHLMQLYFHDFSEFTGWVVDETGRFEDSRYLDHYWTEEGRVPFLIRVDGAIGGFALVRQVEGDTGPESHVAEFFIMRAYRRGGAGRVAALALFSRFPGRWRLEVMPENATAAAFWQRVVTEATAGTFGHGYDDDARRWWYTFDTSG